jgi:aminoglycoside phosphotransferase (APT) family kinase protein
MPERTDALPLPDNAITARLCVYLQTRIAADEVAVYSITRLSGGAIQENWALRINVRGGLHAGGQTWVLRCNASATVATSLSRAHEFAILSVAHNAGVKVAKPILLCEDSAVIGSEFFIMEHVPGTGAGHKLVKDDSLVPDRPALLRELGKNLASLHWVHPPLPELAFLGEPTARPIIDNIRRQQTFLDALPGGYPVLEWGLRRLELHAPAQEAVCLVHRDFRTGNFLVDNGRLTAILDWEFAAWGNPMEDIGWFFAKCWRFGQNERRAGGIGDAEDFLLAYEDHSGRRVERAALPYWELLAHVRWAVIALQQAQRHLSGDQRSLELALTGRMVPRLEAEILELAQETN